MNVTGVENRQASSAAATNVQGGNRGLNRDSFMQLLLLQMRSQDPMSPMDSSQMFDQMAQLSMLEQLWDMRDLLTRSEATQQLSQGSMLIGRYVEANTADQGSVSGLVDQVRRVSGTVWLQIGGQEVRLDDIVSVQ